MEGFATQDAVRMDITFYVMSQGWYISPLANTQQNILLLGNHHLWHYPSIIRVNLFYLFMSLFKLIHLAHGSEIPGSVLDAADVTIGKKKFQTLPSFHFGCSHKWELLTKGILPSLTASIKRLL